MANKKNNFGVTAIIGTVLLLAMAIGLFSVLNVIVFSFPVSPRSPSVSLVASVEFNEDGVPINIFVEHNGGEALSKDDIRIIVPSADITFFTDDELFSIGDLWEYSVTVEDEYDIDIVSVTVVHISTNSILMMGSFQAGELT